MGLEPPLIQWEENLDPSWSLGIRDKDRHGCWWLSFWNYLRIRFRCFLSFREVAKTMKKNDMINIPQLMLIRQELSWIKLTGLMVSQGYHCSFWTCFMKPPSKKRHLHTSTLKTTLFYHTWLWFFQNPTPTHGKWGSLFFLCPALMLFLANHSRRLPDTGNWLKGTSYRKTVFLLYSSKVPVCIHVCKLCIHTYIHTIRLFNSLRGKKASCY